MWRFELKLTANPLGKVDTRSWSSVNGSSARTLSSKHQRSHAAYQLTTAILHKSQTSLACVMCLGQGADLQMAQLIPLPLTISCSNKSILVLPFWYQLTWIVSDKRPLNGCSSVISMALCFTNVQQLH